MSEKILWHSQLLRAHQHILHPCLTGILSSLNHYEHKGNYKGFDFYHNKYISKGRSEIWI